MKILTISCHPDDIEIAAGGTIRKYADRGDEVTVCHVANGSQGHVVIQPDELRRIRIREACEGGRLMGAKQVICMDVNDLEIDSNDQSLVTAMVEVIRYVQPDLIITHSPNDYMKDHVEVSRLAFDASFSATVPHFATKDYMKDKPFYMRRPVFDAQFDAAPPFEMGTAAFMHAFPPIFYMDTLAGVDFQPEHYVDITDQIEIKLQALDRHESQTKWMLEHDHIDFCEMVRTCSKYRGYQCGVQYAEGFIPCRAYPRMPVNGLLP